MMVSNVNLNNGVTLRPIQPVYQTRVNSRFSSFPTGRIRVSEIRLASTGVIFGKSYIRYARIKESIMGVRDR